MYNAHSKLTQVKFHEDTLIAIEKDNKVYVAMKPIAESLGLQWKAQHKRIQRDTVLSKGISIMEIPSAGGPQLTTFLELKKFHGWLFKVSVNKVDPLTRAKLIRYQEECYEVLFEHFNPTAKPKPIPSPAPDEDVHWEGEFLVTQYNGPKAMFNRAGYLFLADFFMFNNGVKRLITMLLSL
ncbi:MAG: phage antirepressor N-terminal domain-containing protein [Nitrospirae bacterium]|nr:phage antirepressor N-terminal domain-containing protein [Nitrospirota bacterium]